MDHEAKVFMRGQRIYEKYVKDTHTHTPTLMYACTHTFDVNCLLENVSTSAKSSGWVDVKCVCAAFLGS